MHTKIYDDQLIVITGASGFIGSNVVSLLNSKGFNNLILVDDFRESPKWKNLVGKKYIDYISRTALFSWLEGREREIEAFIHLGACSDTTCKDGDYITDNNYRFSVELAEYAMQNEHRFIYASSAATYGDGKLGFSDNHDGIDDLKPLNLYGYSKQMFDQWILRQGMIDEVVGMKYFNIFGPNEYHKGRMASMVFHMTKQVLTTGKIELFKSNDPDNYKDGDQCRDFLYVKDAAEMTCGFLDSDLNGIFNVGMGKTHTWNQMARAVFKALGKDVNISYVEMPKDLSKQYQNYTKADMSKSDGHRKEFTPFEDAVEDYVKNHLIAYYNG